MCFNRTSGHGDVFENGLESPQHDPGKFVCCILHVTTRRLFAKKKEASAFPGKFLESPMVPPSGEVSLGVCIFFFDINCASCPEILPEVSILHCGASIFLTLVVLKATKLVEMP